MEQVSGLRGVVRKAVILLLAAVLAIGLAPVVPYAAATAYAAEGDVATVGEQGYSDLATAIQDANGQTVVLTDDIELQEGLTIPAGSTVTLDLSGHDITASDGVALENLVVVSSGATLTVQDSANAGGFIGGAFEKSSILVLGSLNLNSGTITNSSGYGVFINAAEASFNMAGGAVVGGSEGVRAQFGGHADLRGGTVSANAESGTALNLLASSASVSGTARLEGFYGVFLYNIANGAVDNVPGETQSSRFEMSGGIIDCTVFALSGNNLQSALCSAEITDGTMIADSTCIYWPMEGALTIVDGSFTGSTALEAKMGTIDIQGGSFTSTGEYSSAYTGNGSADDGSVVKFVGQIYGSSASEVQWLESPSLTVDITGGTFTSQNGNAISIYNNGTNLDSAGQLLKASFAISDTASLVPASDKDGVRVVSVSSDYSVQDGAVRNGNTTIVNSQVVEAVAVASSPTITAYGNDSNPTKTETTYTLGSSLTNVMDVVSSAPDAIGDTSQNATITLLRDVTEDVTIPEDTSVTLDLGEHTLTGTVTNNGTLVLDGTGKHVGQVVGNAPTGGEGVTTVVAQIGDVTYPTLDEAIAAAAQQAAPVEIDLVADVQIVQTSSLPAGVTLDGNDHTVTLSETPNPDNGGVFNVVNDSVTIKNLTINTNGHAKYGVQFYCCEGGALENCVINGGRFASINVNGAAVSVTGCDLNPDTANHAYANIDYSMPGNAVATELDYPKLALDDVTYDDSVKLVHVDSAAQLAIAKNLKLVGADATTDALTSDVVAQIIDQLNENAFEGVELSTGADGSLTGSEPAPIVPPSPATYAVNVEAADNGSVEASATAARAGATVTLTVEADEGYELASLLVTDAEGNNVALTETDGAYTFTMPASAVTVTAAFAAVEPEPWENPFVDVAEGDWFYPAVEFVASNGIMNGHGPDYTRFGPDDVLSRGMMVQILYNMAGRPSATYEGTFSDVAEGSTYAAAAEWAASEGIANGDEGEGTFRPDDPVTREEMAAFMCRYAAYAGSDVTADASALEAFPDAGEVSPWAIEEMAWAVEAHVINGVSGVELQPTGNAVRSHVAQMIMNYQGGVA